MTHLPDKRGRVALVILMVPAARCALGIASYLSVVSLRDGMTPAGCGGSSGCAQVRASHWSHIAGVPVSLLAVGLYLVVIVALVMAGFDQGWRRRVAWQVLRLAAVAILAAAGWFIFLQLAVLHAICPYCMADHTLGVMLAIGVLYVGGRTASTSGAPMPARWPAALGLGILPVVVLAGVQWMTPPHVERTTMTLLDGKLVLDPAATPHLGPADAEQTLVVLFDYSCPHCRRTHALLQKMLGQTERPFRVMLLPVALSPACNPYVHGPMSARFDDACERARLALAVFHAAPEKFGAFDHWLFARRSRPAVTRRGPRRRG